MQELRYNYKGAAALWSEYFNLAVAYPLDDNERQAARREFMRGVVQGDSKQYTDYIKELIEEARPVEGSKSRCFDFEYENELESLRRRIFTFSHCIERYI